MTIKLSEKAVEEIVTREVAEAVAEERNAWIEAADTEALSPDETYASGARNVKERVLAAIRARGEQGDG